MNPESHKCLDTMGGREGASVGVYSCHGQAGNQVSGCGSIVTSYF